MLGDGVGRGDAMAIRSHQTTMSKTYKLAHGEPESLSSTHWPFLTS